MSRVLGWTILLLSGATPLFAQDSTPPALSSPQPPARTARFESGVEVVALNVTVTDRRRDYVKNLTRDDFLVLDEGVPQEIALFRDGAVPVDLAVLIDVSASVRGQFETVRHAAMQLLASLGPEDRGAVIGFNERVQVLAQWTGDQGDLARSLDEIRPRGGTSLYTAIYVALRNLAGTGDASAAPRRQAIVVLSDGDDTTSLLTYDDVLEACRRAGVSVYTIRVARPSERTVELLTLRRNRRPDLDYGMRALASETGARSFTLDAVGDLPAVYADIAQELAHQYLIGYVPLPGGSRETAFRKVRVTLRGREGLTARTRLGYLGRVPERATREPAR